MTDLEKRAMGREPFARAEIEEWYELYEGNPLVEALCESHMRVLMELEELRRTITHSKSLVTP